MQGTNGEGLNEEFLEAKRDYWRKRRALDEADARLTLLEEQMRVANMTPEERHEDVRRRTAAIAIFKRALAGAGILLALDWLRRSPKEAVAATALSAVAAVGTIGGIPGAVEWEVGPGDPPMVVSTPTMKPPDSRKSVAPTPVPDDDDAPAPTGGPSLGSGDPSDGSPSAPTTTGAPVPTSSPTGTGAPLPPSPSGTPGPTPTRPPDPLPPDESPLPSPSQTPTVTATPSPSPTPTVTFTPTAIPTAPPAVPEECILVIDLPPLLEACLIDLEQGGEGQLLDGALGGRGLYG